MAPFDSDEGNSTGCVAICAPCIRQLFEFMYFIGRERQRLESPGQLYFDHTSRGASIPPSFFNSTEGINDLYQRHTNIVLFRSYDFQFQIELTRVTLYLLSN